MFSGLSENLTKSVGKIFARKNFQVRWFEVLPSAGRVSSPPPKNKQTNKQTNKQRKRNWKEQGPVGYKIEVPLIKRNIHYEQRR